MIISHKHKFIFLKTAKTAGTSIEIALSQSCGPDDIITPILREDEAIRKTAGYPGAQNCFSPVSDYGVRDVARLLLRRKRKTRFYNHISAAGVRDRVAANIWGDYYKFCFERNPFDRVISHYYWCNKTEPRPTISDFIRSNAVLGLKRQGHGIYTIDGRIAVDKVCRFENIEDELEAVRQFVGISDSLVMPRAKSSQRTDKRSYREILSEPDRNRISELFRDEIELFGYEF